MATRVYKYGLIPIGYPAQAAIDELFRANNLWNTLVALHRESRENWGDARRSASIFCSEKMDELEQKEKGEIFAELKPLRKDADTKIDKKALNDEYREKCTKAISVKNCGIYSRTADQIYANFRTARDKAFKDNATMRFHPFDGTGYFQFRCTLKGSKTDGISVD